MCYSRKNELWQLMMFNRNGSGLDKRMLVVVIFPVSFLAVPPVVMAMPIFVIPIVVPAVLVSSGRERGSNY